MLLWSHATTVRGPALVDHQEAVIRRVFILSGFVGMACLLGWGIIALKQSTVVAQQLNDWHILRRPERLSELYFSNYEQLRVAPEPGKSKPVSFGVRNLEHRPTTYRYAVSIKPLGKNEYTPLHAGSFQLKHGQFQTITRDITVPSLAMRTMVKVEIGYDSIAPGADRPTPHTQSIHHWINPIEPPRDETGI